jgi:ElaB/YqjD/DUF883 family membrane-anchored ribosome-binding protein
LAIQQLLELHKNGCCQRAYYVSTYHEWHAATHAAGAIGQKGEQLRNAEQQFIEDCRAYIHENPVASLGIAVGAGFLLSRLISGR